MAKWVFYILVFVYMCYRAVYGARAVTDGGITVDPINYGSLGYLEVGTRKTITCRASNRNQKLEWLDPFGVVIKRIPNNRVFAQEYFASNPKGVRTPGIVLTLTDLAASDSGIYQCKSGEQNKSVGLCVIKPLEFVDTQQEVTIEAGRSITLSCQANGDPEPTIVWGRGVHEIAEGVDDPKYMVNRKYYSQGYESLLTITSVEPDDADVYTCVAIQAHSMLDNCTYTDRTNITLRVYFAPMFKNNETSEDKVYGRNNEIINIKCSAKGWPKPTYRWFKDLGGDTFYEYDKSKIDFSEETNTATISVTAGPTTYGSSYKCVASNRIGEKEMHFKLLRREKPWKPDYVEAKFVSNNRISFNVTWDEEPLFPIDKYDIQYLFASKPPGKNDWKYAKQIVSKIDEDEDEDKDEDESDDKKDDENDEEEDEGMVIELDEVEPDTDCFIRLRAANEAGESPWSETVHVSALDETTTEAGEVDEAEEPTAEAEVNTDTGMFYGIFFAGSILVVVFVCMFVMRLV